MDDATAASPAADPAEWADRLADIYARRARLDPAGRAALGAEIGEALAAAAHVGRPLADWPHHANLALDDWERRTGARGPRFAGLHGATGAVRLARAD